MSSGVTGSTSLPKILQKSPCVCMFLAKLPVGASDKRRSSMAALKSPSAALLPAMPHEVFSFSGAPPAPKRKSGSSRQHRTLLCELDDETVAFLDQETAVAYAIDLSSRAVAGPYKAPAESPWTGDVWYPFILPGTLRLRVGL